MDSRKSTLADMLTVQLLVPSIPPGPRICVPVRAAGFMVLDRDGNLLATCAMPELAARIAYIINEHADV